MIVKNDPETTSIASGSEWHGKAHDVVNGVTARTAIVDEPPPYYEAGRAGPSMPIPVPQWPEQGPSTSTPSSPSGVPTAQPILRSAVTQTVNMISLFSKHNTISGTYLVDPALPASPFSTGLSERSMRKIQRRGRSIDRDHARNAARAFGDDSDPDTSDSGFVRRGAVAAVNAAFRTRHGRITVDLGVVGYNAEGPGPSRKQRKQRKQRARIMLSSRHGTVNVDLKEVQPQRCVDLDVSTRHGNITILLPLTFDGAIAVHARNGSGSVRFLPAFAERARTVRAHDRETHVLLSPNVSPQYPGQEGEDRCIVSTRHGRVTFGISGIDTVDFTGPVSGLFKMLGEFVKKM